jgi:hypothetical protein
LPVVLEKAHWWLPRWRCGNCQTITTAAAPWAQAGSVVYEPNIVAIGVPVQRFRSGQLSEHLELARPEATLIYAMESSWSREFAAGIWREVADDFSRSRVFSNLRDSSQARLPDIPLRMMANIDVADG